MILLIDRFGKMLLAVLHCIFKSLQRLFLFRISTNGTAFFILKKLAHSALKLFKRLFVETNAAYSSPALSF